MIGEEYMMGAYSRMEGVVQGQIDTLNPNSNIPKRDMIYGWNLVQFLAHFWFTLLFAHQLD